ncbi:uncharacterized protein BDV17DRAFT_295188 [Aspergillus undulatus]|uniref:uncharacterized protein n=1 Tax=Aspergillus undulatus TaxID=1810928 RepID=UPI003CCDE06B
MAALETDLHEASVILAIGAFSSSWSNINDADGLTRHQTNGDHRNGGEVKVIACLTAKNEKDEVSLDVLRYLNVSVPDRNFSDMSVEYGMVLYKPDGGVFTGKASDCGYDRDENLERSILNAIPEADRNLDIFVLFLTTAEKLEEMRSTIQEAVDETRETIDEGKNTIEQTQKKSGKKPLPTAVNDMTHFLLHPLHEAGKKSSPFVTVYCNREGPLVVAQNSLETVTTPSIRRTPLTAPTVLPTAIPSRLSQM